MQVNRIDDQVTHAVLSPNAVRGAQISESAEFFSVLSSTLYSNKKLAVVREVLCNAWDIHIQQGIIDKAVEVTISGGKITFRDYGSGIHDDHIVDVYLTYGNSTKKLDGTQTGGFGLGSKSPWAVVDHFEVESFHQGTKTAYTMSKSSGEVGGKPSATPMYSIPTKETGLKVSFAISTTPKEEHEYHQLVRMIASFGEMNVILNGEQIPVYEFSKAPHNLLLVDRSQAKTLPEGQSRTVFVRYGNVVYPIPADTRLDSYISRLSTETASFGKQGHYSSDMSSYIVIIQAKPNTISVTPSRESLSMTEATVNALRELMEEALESFYAEVRVDLVGIAQETIQTSWLHRSPSSLLNSDNKLPFQTTDQYIRADSIATPREAGVALLRTGYPLRDAKFKRKETLARLDALAISGFGNRGKIQSFRKAYYKTTHPQKVAAIYRPGAGWVDCSSWFQRVLVQPIIRKMREHPDMVEKNFLVKGKHSDPKRSRHYSGDSMVPATSLSQRMLIDYMPFLRNIVVLSYNRIDVTDRLHRIPAMTHWFGETSDLFVYVVSRTAGKAESAKKFFEGLGMFVVDLTIAYAHEPQNVVVATPKPAVVKPRKKGLVKLTEAIVTREDKTKFVKLGQLGRDEAARTEVVKTYLMVNLRASNPVESNRPSWLEQRYLEQFIMLFADDYTGIVNNANQEARFKSLGAKNLYDVLKDELYEALLKNLNVRKAITRNIEMSEHPWQYNGSIRKLLSAFQEDAALCKVVGFDYIKLTAKEKLFVVLGKKAVRSPYGFPQDILKDCKLGDKDLVIDPAYLKLADSLKGAPLLQALDLDQYASMFGAGSTQTPARKKLREGYIDLLVYALEG